MKVIVILDPEPYALKLVLDKVLETNECPMKLGGMMLEGIVTNMRHADSAVQDLVQRVATMGRKYPESESKTEPENKVEPEKVESQADKPKGKKEKGGKS